MCVPVAVGHHTQNTRSASRLGPGYKEASARIVQWARAHTQLKREEREHAAAAAQSSGLDPRYWYIHGKPHDLTPWMAEHPGGSVILSASQGTDCTTLFESYHAASLRTEWISAVTARYVVPGAPCIPVDPAWATTPVYDDLRQILLKYRMEHGIKATRAAALWSTGCGVVHYAFLALWLVGWGAWWIPLAFGLTLWFFSADMMHTGTHYALCKSAPLSRALGAVGGWMFCLPHTWMRQHVTGHHVHTNENHADPDLYHWKRYHDVSPYLDDADYDGEGEKAGKITWLWYVVPVFTQIAPPLVCTLEILSSGRWVGVKDKIRFYRSEQAILLAEWSVYAAMIAAVSWSHGLAWGLVPWAVVGLCFYGFSQVSHLNSASFQVPVTREWAVHEITTAQGDYSYDSLLWNKVSIGLNNQGMHHMFPSVHPCHYPELSRRMRHIYKKHGLPQAGYTQTYRDSLALHCAWLRYINR